MKTKMKTTLMLLLFPLLLFLVAHADASSETDLKCSKKTIAELGKDVTLDCYCEPRCDVNGEELKWKFNQKTNVLAYMGTHDAKNQDAQFIGRAQVSSAERLNNGNFSVTISKVRKSDEGNYTCHVGSKTCSVELKEFKLKCQEKPVEVHVGENVTLNCKSEPQLNLTEEKITWKFEKKVVYMYRHKGFRNEKHQDEQFEGRVHPVSDWDVSEGKLSVEISSVNESDTGVYICWVIHKKFKLRSNCTVTLTVKKEDKQTSGAQGDNNTTTTDGAQGGNIPPPSRTIIVIVAVVGGVLVAAVIGALTWKFHEKCRTQKPSQESIDLTSTTKNEERSPSDADPLTAPS